MELIERIFDSKYQQGILTRYPSLDKILGGIKRSSLVILAGATGMGKSLLLLNILVKLAKAGHKSLYFDLENGKELTAQRALMIWYGLTKDYFLDKKNQEDAKARYGKIKQFIEIYDHEDVYRIADASGIPVDRVIKNLINGTAAEIVAIDPLQFFESSAADFEVLKVQTEITKVFKEQAQRLAIPIIICHHIRKSTTGGGTWIEDIDDAQVVKYRIPSIDDLKGSSGITQYATDVWAMVRTAGHSSPEGRGKTFFRVLKARRGLQGDTKDLFFEEDTLRFIDRNAPNETREVIQPFEGALFE